MSLHLKKRQPRDAHSHSTAAGVSVAARETEIARQSGTYNSLQSLCFIVDAHSHRTAASECVCERDGDSEAIQHMCIILYRVSAFAGRYRGYQVEEIRSRKKVLQMYSTTGWDGI